MSDIALKPCPFCGCDPRYSQNALPLLGCVNPGCPIRGILMTKEQWEKRS